MRGKGNGSRTNRLILSPIYKQKKVRARRKRETQGGGEYFKRQQKWLSLTREDRDAREMEGLFGASGGRSSRGGEKADGIF